MVRVICDQCKNHAAMKKRPLRGLTKCPHCGEVLKPRDE